jgi:hypothetical protein
MIDASHPVEISPGPAKEAHRPRLLVHTGRLAAQGSELPDPAIADAEILPIMRFVRTHPFISF